MPRPAPLLFSLFALSGSLSLALPADIYDDPYLAFDHPAIQYSDGALHDPAQRLYRQISAGTAALDFDPRHGFLPSLLRALDVPVSSQVLVFSKTSFQAARISPQAPRAIYFNDHVMIGSVRGGEVLEIAAVDPRQGVAFYTLDQRPGRARIARRGDCIGCHISSETLGVPGILVRSVHPDRSGMPVFGGSIRVTDHRSPLAERWGGWYVTGTQGSQQHMGNAWDEAVDRHEGVNVSALSRFFDTRDYLSPDSDEVALMVLEHQTRMTNLITRLGWQTRIAMDEREDGGPPWENGLPKTLQADAESLVRYMLFADEITLTEPVQGTTRFASEFSDRGPRDRKGRSLRDFDLKRRLFRYPLSFLVYSEAFDALPEPALAYVYRRLYGILAAKEAQTGFESLSPADRQAILEILRATKPGLPHYWQARL